VQDNTIPSSQLWLGGSNLHTTEKSQGHLQSNPSQIYNGITQKNVTAGHTFITAENLSVF